MSNCWHVLGVGAIGGLFAHRLSNGGANVRLLTRDSAETRRQLRLETESGVVATQFECDWVDHSSAIDYLLITTKSWAARDALTRIHHRLTDRTVIVAMMNGMQHVDDLRAMVSEAQLFLASTTAGCHRSENTWVPAGIGKTIIGTDADQPEPAWIAYWQRGVPNLVWQSDMSARLIEKVAINCCINPLTAIHRVRNGELMSGNYKNQTNEVIDEVSMILNNLGYHELSTGLHHKVYEVLTDTATNTSSMLNDVLMGRHTEADAIIGWLLRQTDKQVPALQAVATRLRALEPNQ